MRINCHTHVFNFRSLFTQRTVRILLNRLGREGWPDFLVEAAAKALEQLLKGDPLDEEKLLRSVVTSLGVSRKFKQYLAQLGGAIPGNVGLILDGNVDGLAVGALREMLQKLGDLLASQGDIREQTVQDFLAFLAIGFRATIGDVARALMELSGNDTVAVALMLDITEGGKGDEALFQRQIADTARAALAYPGGLLPFVAVNPLRKSHFDLLDRALLQQGCVGVKLYPSLGYPVDSPAMRKVFAHCAANEVPLLMHCNRGGFYLSEAARDHSDPRHWRAILQDFPALKICFGHFGGDENLAADAIPPNSWTRAILDLMGQYPGVYADIAYHTAPMAGGAAEASYFKNLGALLDQPGVRDRILFGSDFFLVRMRLREDNHWRYFERQFSAAHFKRVTETNPAAFLGLPGADGAGAARNIRRHVDFLVSRKFEVGAPPAPWVLAAVRQAYGDTVQFVPNPFGLRWSINNDAHYYADQFLRTQMSEVHRKTCNFLQAGGLLVRELLTWPGEQTPKAIREEKLRMLAARMHLFLVNPAKKGGPGAEPEKGVSRTTAEAALRGLFANGESRLAEFGVVVDKHYRFRSEGTPA